MRTLALAALLPLLRDTASACAVCFGGATGGNKGFFDGIWWGIVLLIAVTFSMVGGIGWLLYKVEKNRLTHEARG